MDDTTHPTRSDPAKNRSHNADEVIKIKLRVDANVTDRSITWSFVAWKHPQAELLSNELGESDEPDRIDETVDMICNQIWKTLEDALGPFPYTTVWHTD